jgi:hypothetical protein
MSPRDVWNDPVWSKVIGTLMAGGILGIWTRLSGNAGFLWLRIPVWSALLMLIAGFLVSILSLSKLGRTTFASEPKVVLGEVFVYPPDSKKTLTFPLKCHAVFRNESERCIEVRVQGYEPGLVTLQQFVFRVLQVEMKDGWVPEPEATDVIAVLPKQYFRAWVGVDATRFTADIVRKQFGKIGILTLSVNGRPMPFQL